MGDGGNIDQGALFSTPVVRHANNGFESAAFAEFYETYPRHVGRGAARKAWNGALRVASIDMILAGVRRYAADPNLPPRGYIPHPATWLRGERWADEPEPVRGDDRLGAALRRLGHL